MQKQKPILHSPSTGSILKVVVILLLVLFLWHVREVLAILFTALIFASALEVWVDRMQLRHIPRGLSVIFIYAVIAGVFGLIVYLLIPPISHQVGELSRSFPYYYEKIVSTFTDLRTLSQEYGLEKNIQQGFGLLNERLGQSVGGIFSAISALFGNIAAFFLVLILTFYMVVEASAMKRVLRQFLPDYYQPYASQLVNKIQYKVGAWLQGQLVLCFVIGFITTLLLWIFGIKYALVLGLIAGVFEFIPYLGPMFSAIPAVFLAFFQDPIKAIIVIGIYIGVQQLENNLLVPKIMQRAIGLNPVITITSLLIGMKVGGVIGALLSIPVATAISVVIKEFFQGGEERTV